MWGSVCLRLSESVCVMVRVCLRTQCGKPLASCAATLGRNTHQRTIKSSYMHLYATVACCSCIRQLYSLMFSLSLSLSLWRVQTSFWPNRFSSAKTPKSLAKDDPLLGILAALTSSSTNRGSENHTMPCLAKGAHAVRTDIPELSQTEEPEQHRAVERVDWSALG